MEEKKTMGVDKELQKMYKEIGRLRKLILKVDLDIKKHIEKNYPDIAKDIEASIKRAAMYKDGFKKKRRY